jgi:hypothetical protein
MPMVHPCARPGCRTLTMGERCLEHEQHADLRVHVQKLFPRVATATALVAAAATGALIGTRLPR